jgi:glutamate formiminotransferase/glutamate formiminotransferase/formiminotetrahydrofolate cyclodeaminase
MKSPILLGVPNVSEGRDERTIAALGEAFTSSSSPDGPGARLLDVHSDSDHHRSVFTLAAPARTLADALLAGAAAAVERIDVMSRSGADPAQSGGHPYVGAVDVVPVVYLQESARGDACAEALTVADRIGHELQIPVFLYGELTQELDARGEGEPVRARTRAELRRGGVEGLMERMAARAMGTARQGPLRPDFGPPRMHRTAGATLVAARPPLVAFNVQLAAGATLADARAIAALIREGGERGLPGVRAMAVALGGGVMQVSMNVERPLELSLGEVVAAVAAHAPVQSAELVGLAPAAAMEGFPEDVALISYDPARQVLEKALGS